MEGMEAILDRILAEARDASTCLISQADQVAAGIMAAAQANVNEILKKAGEQASFQTGTILAKARSTAAMEQRKALLRARQELIDKAICRAAEIVENLPDSEKIMFYWNLAARSDIKSGFIILPENDRHLGPAVLADHDGKGALTLDAIFGNFTSGLIIRQGQVEDNMTLELLLKSDRDQLVQIAVDTLFPSKENCMDRPAGCKRGLIS